MVATSQVQDVETTRVLFRALARTAPTTDAELVYWVKTILGVPLPTSVVSEPGIATSPAQFICDVYFERYSGYLVLGSRDSFKTLSLSIIHFLNSLFKPGCETVSVGGIELQAKKARAYVEGFLRRRWAEVSPVMDFGKSNDPNDILVFGDKGGPVIRDIQTEDIFFTNGSHVQILPATIRAVSGPHPQKAAADEVELWDWSILMKWWGIASRGKTPYRAQRILTSTRDTMTGTMNRLVKEAAQRNLRLYQWNVYDAMQGCGKAFGGCLCETPEGLDKSRCILWENGCEGKAVTSDGSKPHEEVVDLRMGTDDETWETQYVCSKPSKKSHVYSGFDIITHVTEEAEYHPAKGGIYLAIDPGFTDPYAVALAQLTPFSIDFFDEVYVTGKGAQDVKQMLVTGDILVQRPDGKSTTVHREWFKVSDGYGAKYVENLEWGTCDYHMPQDRTVWVLSQEVTVRNPDGLDQQVILPSFRIVKAENAGIAARLSAVRRRLMITKVGPGLRVHPRCEKLIWEFTEGYMYKMDPSTGEPQSETPADRNNHLMDAVGDLILKLDRPHAGVRAL